ncbi:uncharacterized protein LOC112517796 [Cynara cardunculus var. scolymus]|uniref:Transmembrane protein n=1 Tax=Cynara cardunculus var. scolymus TaxID=59895 RepID=A0A103XPF6_CYNCS|nr:uncharacterized protein LOC112517796 [Cynara cardunculus var. scolymus]KVH94502.1 hypothetical protein Ccrd_003423 [Cynara cardunculus var. scolymus]
MASMKVTKLELQMISCENIIMKLKETLQVLTITLLSLLLPLSFLLLARLSTASYLLSLNGDFPAAEPPSLVFFSLLLKYIPLSPLHLLVSLVCIASLVHTLNDGRITFPSFSVSPATTVRPRLYTAWIVLCTLQVCVGLGIEGSIGAGIVGGGFGQESNLICRIVFFLGLHGTTVYWSRMIVKPVVDDTMFGYEMEERWMDRVVMGVSLGGLWWWKLRDEVESLVGVTTGVGVGAVELLGWWLYYVVVTIGMVRVVKGLIWFGVILLYRKVEQTSDDVDNGSSLRVQEKV